MIKKIILIIFVLIILTGGFFLSPLHKKNDNLNNSKDVVTRDKPRDDEPYKESKIIKSEVADEKKEIELKYDEYVVANGYIGASDNAYYTRNNVLYHLIISTNTTTRIAEGIKKIEGDKDFLIAYKGDNFKIIKDDDYVTYVD